MSSTTTDILALACGVLWTIAYIDIIRKSLADGRCGMPLFALAPNLAWEFICGVLIDYEHPLQQSINIVWLLLDLVIVWIYFRFGRRDYRGLAERWFLPWSLLAFALSGAVMYTAVASYGVTGARYAAYLQSVTMSLLFIVMLDRRRSRDGQSQTIAVSKWAGTSVQTCRMWLLTHDPVILALGLTCFLYDLVYVYLLSRFPHSSNLP